MKNYRYVVGALIATLSIISCQKVNNIDELEVISEGQAFELFASVADTKTSIGENFAVSWNDNDQINVFHAESNSANYISDGAFSIDDAENGHFVGTVSDIDAEKSYDWYAFYPYDSHIVTPASTNVGYVTVGGDGQTQEGNDSYAHIAGSNMPLYGKLTGVNGDATPEIAMKQICSVIEVKVKNTTADPLTVSSVSFTGTEDIVGTYYINFVGESPVLTASGSSYVSETVSLAVNKGDEIATNGEAYFYIAIKPFTAASGSQLKIAVNGCQKTINLTKETSFTSGKIKTINFTYEAPAYSPDLTNEEIVAAFSSTTLTGYGDFSITSASGIWTGVMNRGKTLTYVQLRDQSPARLVSPVYQETVKSITINTTNSSAAKRSFYVLPGSGIPSAYSESGISGNIGSYTTTDSNESFTIDFEDATTQFEIVVLGGAAYIGSIDVELGEVEKKLKFDVDTTPIDVAADVTSATFNIEADDEVTWSIGAVDGLSFNPASGSGNAKVTISFSANTSTTNAVERTIIVSTETANVLEPSQEISFIQRQATAAGAKFVKVTKDSDITAGKYLIVWGNEAHATISSKDLVNTKKVSIDNGVIEYTAELDDAAVEFIEKEGGIAVMLPSKKYLSCNASSNQSAEVNDPFVFTKISVANGISGIDTSDKQRYLCQNGSYYRFYTAIGSYVVPTLYKYQN